MALVGVGEASALACRQVQPVELGRFIAAAGARIDQVVACARFVSRDGDRFGLGRELFQFGHRVGQAVDLWRGITRLAVHHHHLALVRVPVGESVAAEVGVELDSVDQRLRDGRDALQHQVGIGREDRPGCGAELRAARQRQHDAGQDQASHDFDAQEAGRLSMKACTPSSADSSIMLQAMVCCASA
jgi:hypothetical protein